MSNGRPAHFHYGSSFYGPGAKENVNSLTEKTDVSGWAWYSGKFKEVVSHGHGK